MADRATVAEVKKMWGGTLPANWTTEADVTNLCGQVDEEVDSKTYPVVLSTSDATVAQLCNEVVYRRMIHANWAHRGGPPAEEPVIWTQDLLDRLAQLSRDSTEGTAGYMKMQADS